MQEMREEKFNDVETDTEVCIDKYGDKYYRI